MTTPFAWLFLSLKGRISRQEFWLGYILTLCVFLVAVPRLQDLGLAGRRPASGPWSRNELEIALLLPKLVVIAAIVWPLTALCVKRLHDVGVSGWWLLAFIGALWLAAVTGLDHRNLVTVALFAVFVPGKRGDNRFGADPIPLRQ